MIIEIFNIVILILYVYQIFYFIFRSSPKRLKKKYAWTIELSY